MAPLRDFVSRNPRNVSSWRSQTRSVGACSQFKLEGRLVRLVQFCEEFVDIDKLAAIGLGHGLKKQALLVRGHADEPLS